MGYESMLIEVPEMQEVLQEINDKGQEIVTVTHIGDSAQLLIVVRDRASKFRSGQMDDGEES